MASWLNLGHITAVNAVRFSDKEAVKDQNRTFSFAELNQRVNRLAHSLYALGLEKGDKVAVLLENSIEIIEVYIATAKTGLIIVPINFRLVGNEIEYIVNNSDAKALIVHDEFAATINGIKPKLENIEARNYIAVKSNETGDYVTAGFQEYESFIKGASQEEPEQRVETSDVWILIYTSGTTGKPKGVLRSHESHISFFLINAIDYGFTDKDVCLNVMPLCHINSVYFTFTFLYLGASVFVHPARSFKAEEILKIVERERITFISLVPTHYNLILSLPPDFIKPDISSIQKLLCSSAPASKSTKKGIMDFFPGVELYEGYGSTEAGSVTVLKPQDQMRKLGSIGQEMTGTSLVKILDEQGKEVGADQVGELYSRGPMLFDEYYKLPEKTISSFREEWFSAGDLAKRDKDGYFYIVDRKDNMIITGGENVYPSEVEDIINSHLDVFDAAVVGMPHEKWGEQIVAIVIAKEEARSRLNEQDILDFCQDKMAGFKRPKQVIFINQDEMPRTATGKILHRLLKEKM